MKKGLIYGMGHAVYSISDPRADVFRAFVKQLAQEKGCEAEYALYEKVEHMAPEVIAEKRKILQRCQCECGLLQWSGVQYAGSSSVTVYTDLCGCTYCRMECTPSGRAEECG